MFLKFFSLHEMDILVVFRSLDLLWSDCMTNNQTTHRKGSSGPSGVTAFLCGLWESLLPSIDLCFLTWEP